MTPQLYLTCGTTTLDFQADGYEVVGGFYPETADEGMESISDQFEVVIRGSSGADVHSKITAIRLAFEHARRHKDDAQAAWLYYDVESSGNAWMSKLLDGDTIYDSRPESPWRHNLVVATIIIERKPYWDAKDEVQVPLTNGNGTNNTTGLTVYNHDDAGTSPAHDNWVDIVGADIDGDLPGPTRLEAINTFASLRLYTLFIGQNWINPSSFSHILEGESSSSGTERNDSTCSGGKYREYELVNTLETDMFTLALSDNLLDEAQGRYYKLLGRFYALAPTNVKYRIRLLYNSGTIWQTGQFNLDSSRALSIRDMATFRLPPWLLGQSDLSALSMVLTGQIFSGTQLVNLDFLQITPLDDWRMLECAGYGVVENSRMIDDAMNETKYIDDGSGDNKAGILVGYGNPIHLYPGKDQRLYFLMHSHTANIAEILRTISVKLFYRPRRKTL